MNTLVEADVTCLGSGVDSLFISGVAGCRGKAYTQAARKLISGSKLWSWMLAELPERYGRAAALAWQVLQGLATPPYTVYNDRDPLNRSRPLPVGTFPRIFNPANKRDCDSAEGAFLGPSYL